MGRHIYDIHGVSGNGVSFFVQTTLGAWKRGSSGATGCFMLFLYPVVVVWRFSKFSPVVAISLVGKKGGFGRPNVHCCCQSLLLLREYDPEASKDFRPLRRTANGLGIPPAKRKQGPSFFSRGRMRDPQGLFGA